MKMVVIGNAETVLGFSLAGVDGQIAESASQANLALDQALNDPQVRHSDSNRGYSGLGSCQNGSTEDA